MKVALGAAASISVTRAHRWYSSGLAVIAASVSTASYRRGALGPRRAVANHRAAEAYHRVGGLMAHFLRMFAAALIGSNFLPPAEPTLQAHSHERGTAFTCHVTGVHDGDGPIYCAEGPKIRLAAVAARELDGTCNPDGQPCPAGTGVDARDALDRLTRGKVLHCEAAGMSYGRTVAWCWLPGGEQLNCAIVRTGLALPWSRYDPRGRLCS